MKRMYLRAALLSLLPPLAFSAIAGCGGGQPERARVTGTVSLDGQPLETGAVIFTPESGRAATGEIGPDGSYALGTYGQRDGALPGRHQVAVIAREEASSQERGPMRTAVGRSLIPEHYGNAATSGLAFDVKAGEKNVFDIELSSQSQPASPP